MNAYGDLTGNIRFRQNLRGRMILQVEYHDSAWLGQVVRFKSWRDAKLHDLKTGTYYGNTAAEVCLRMPDESSPRSKPLVETPKSDSMRSTRAGNSAENPSNSTS